MANLVFMGKTGLTGGEATKLDSIDGATLTDNDAAFVNVSNVQYIYRLDADSGAAESSPNIIAPDTNPGTKRWILQGLNGASLTLSGLTASLPVFTDGSKNLVSKSVVDTLTALGVGAWTDYSGTSTVVGWSSFTSKAIYYKSDKTAAGMVFVDFLLAGTSNTDNIVFTVPFQAARTIYFPCTFSLDDSSLVVAYGTATAGSANITIERADAAWTTSGTKRVAGQFFYPV
jgi:hypothetical protein